MYRRQKMDMKVDQWKKENSDQNWKEEEQRRKQGATPFFFGKVSR
jgi:hypothetical protein